MCSPAALSTATNINTIGYIPQAKNSPLTELNSNKTGAFSTTTPESVITKTLSPVIEMDEAAQLDAEITICAKTVLSMITAALFQEIKEEDNKIDSEKKITIGIFNKAADTEAGRNHVNKYPIDLDRFVRRYIFNVEDKYTSKLDEDSAEAFADCTMQVVEKMTELSVNSCSIGIARAVDQKLMAPDICFKSFAAEILAHPRGEAYNNTPLANARLIESMFEHTPLIKGEMENIWPVKK